MYQGIPTEMIRFSTVQIMYKCFLIWIQWCLLPFSLVHINFILFNAGPV